ncbi:MAG: hypothetical protein RRA15_11595 [bacterium]|nr:hypothetical protein [bacterium]
MKEVFPLRRISFIKGTFAMAVLAAIETTGYSMVDDSALRIVRADIGQVYGIIPITFNYAFVEALACASWLGIFLLFRSGSTKMAQVPFRWAAGTEVLIYLTYGMALLPLAYARDVSLIVAFRQVSILAAALMGIVFLKEPVHRWKVIGLATMFAGLVLVALS